MAWRGRKIGVGFNHPRVLGGRMQLDYRRRWDLMRRMTRLVRVRQVRWQEPLAASVLETSRRYLSSRA